MGKSKIEWVRNADGTNGETWNPVTGCTRVSSGCDNCYAASMTRRLAAMPATKEKYGGLINEGKKHFNGVVKCHDDVLEIPLRWRKPRVVFVNSMSDLFHPGVPFEFIDKVFAVMAMTPQHTYQVLTKRPERMAEYFNDRDDAFSTRVRIMTELDLMGEDPKLFDKACSAGSRIVFKGLPLDNIWLGTSVENQKTADERIPHLLKCPAAVRFLSMEPLLGPVDDLRFIGCPECGKSENDWFPNYTLCRACGREVKSPPDNRIHWVIVGGESGPNARPMHPGWVRSLRDQCTEAGVPYFFKQWGAWYPIRGFCVTDRIKDGWEISDDNPVFDGQLMKHGQLKKIEGQNFFKVGKKEAGRLLDGKEWNQMPQQVNPKQN